MKSFVTKDKKALDRPILDQKATALRKSHINDSQHESRLSWASPKAKDQPSKRKSKTNFK
jgi:hypothetical protein